MEINVGIRRRRRRRWTMLAAMDEEDSSRQAKEKEKDFKELFSSVETLGIEIPVA